MADRAGVERRIARLFETQLSVRVPSAETDLFETGALDSLGFVDLLLKLEEEFAITAPLADLELDTFRSIAGIAEFVLQRNGRGG